MGSPSLFFISNRFYRTLNNFGNLNDHIITEFSWVAMTCNVIVAIVKTIVIVAYLPYQSTQNYS